MAIRGRHTDHGPSTVRRVRPDEHGVIAERFGIGGATFRWKYLANPWADVPPVFVLETAGQVRGAIGWIPLQVNGPDGSVDVVVPGDAAVPSEIEDIRRYLFETSLRRLSEMGVSRAIAAPLPHETPPSVIEGWQNAGPIATRVHLRRPSSVVPRMERFDPIVRRAVDGMIRLNRYLRSWQRALGRGTTDIERRDGVPELAFRLLAENAEDEVGTIRRSLRFWRWRCTDPRVRFQTFVRFRHGEADLVAVTATKQVGGVSQTSVLGLDGAVEGSQATASVLATVLAKASGVDLVLVPNDSIPPGTQERLGVFDSREWPLSLLVPERTQRVCRLDPDRSGLTPGFTSPIAIAERTL